MGKQKKTYLLLTVVILVWGLIGYRIFKTVKPSVPKVKLADKTAAFKPFAVIKNDTFSIKTNYRDPFLGTYTTNKKRSTKRVTKKKTEVATKKIIFPNTKYKGIISPKSRNDQRFIIHINQKIVLFKQLETHQEIQLVQGDEKEVVLLYKGEQKTISLQ